MARSAQTVVTEAAIGYPNLVNDSFLSRLFVFAAAYLAADELPVGSSVTDFIRAGGDARAAALLARLPRLSIPPRIVSSRGGTRIFALATPQNAREIIIDRASWSTGYGLLFLGTLFLMRAIGASILVALDRKEGLGAIAYSTSNLLPDVLACASLRAAGVIDRWVAVFHHQAAWEVPQYGGWLERVLSSLQWAISTSLIVWHADRVVVYTSYAEELLKKRGLPESRIIRSSNGIDSEGIVAERDSCTKIPDSVVYVGRLTAQKGVLDLIRAWVKVKHAVPSARLSIIGRDGTVTSQDVASLAESLGVGDSVKVLGEVNRKQLIHTMATGTVLVNPSYVEGWSYTVMEALACATKVVAWDLPVYDEVFPEGIFRAPTGDLDALSEAIITALQSSPDTSSLHRLADRYAKSYSWDEVARAEWESVLNGRRPQTGTLNEFRTESRPR